MTRAEARATRPSETLETLVEEDTEARTTSVRDEPSTREPIMAHPMRSRISDPNPDGANATIAPEKADGQRYVRPMYRLPKLPTFRLLQNWEGYVQAVSGDNVQVILSDLTNPRNPREESDIPLEDISSDDRDLVAPGAMFYWSIGYRRTVFGQVERVSSIRFRRLPTMSARTEQRAKTEALELKKKLGSEHA